VDFEGGILTLRDTKAGRAQVVVMNAPARQVLNQLHRANDSEWVLPSSTDASRPLSKTGIENAWQRIRTAAKLADDQHGRNGNVHYDAADQCEMTGSATAPAARWEKSSTRAVHDIPQ
jgi:hypothetical protein